MKKFRETLWFKRGEVVPETPETQGELPVEDRYLDDDTVCMQDSVVFGVRTGTTAYLKLITVDAGSTEELGAIVEEMRGPRAKLALAGGVVVMVAVVVALFAF